MERGLRPVVVAALFACVVGAAGVMNGCSPFAEGDEGRADAASDGAGPADGANDAVASDAASAPSDGGFVKPPLMCSGTFCQAAERCCMGASAPTCATATCPANTWTMSCFGPADCETGICCWEIASPEARCATSCAGYRLCGETTDCLTGTCAKVSCGGMVDFRACTKGASGPIDYPGPVPNCNRL